MNNKPLEDPKLLGQYEVACRTKERGNPGRAYRQLKVLAGRDLTPGELIEIRLPMAVCLRLLGRPRASNTLFRQLLQQAMAAVEKDEELCLRIILDWSPVLLDQGQPERAAVNLEQEYGKLTQSHPLYWKTKGYLGRAYVRTGRPGAQKKGLDYLSEAIKHLEGPLRLDMMRWKLEAKEWPGDDSRQERREHYEETYALAQQASPVLAVNTYVCYHTGSRLLRPVGIAQGVVYGLRSVLPA